MPNKSQVSNSAAKTAKTSSPAPLLEYKSEVGVNGYFYEVIWKGNVHPRRHLVRKDKTCSCGNPHCPAVQRVANYLRDGGKRVEDYPRGFSPLLPAKCPQCGGNVWREMSLDSGRRGIGWQCENGGTLHYWQHHASAIKRGEGKELYTVDREGNRHGTGITITEHLQAVNQSEAWYYLEPQ